MLFMLLYVCRLKLDGGRASSQCASDEVSFLILLSIGCFAIRSSRLPEGEISATSKPISSVIIPRFEITL